MIKLINEINTLAGSLIPIKEKYKSYKHEIKSNFFINVYGDIEKSNKVMISLHGAGGDRFSNHVMSFCNSFLDEFKEDGCFVTFDMPGVGENINFNRFWGSQINSIDVNLDDIIEFLYNKNKNLNIFISSVSASSIQLLAYMTDKQGVIKNNHKNKIKHYYLISPTGETDETLEWVLMNSKYKNFISFHHTYLQTKFLVNKKNYIKLLELKDCIFDVKKSNYFINKDKKYEFNFDSKIKNCDVILSKNDTITDYNITLNFLNRFNKLNNIIEYNMGGHVGFFDFNVKKRKHEQYVIESVRKYVKKNNW